MISYGEALSLIQEHPLKRHREIRSCLDALGQVLAVDIPAPIDLPPFATSAVDGFAIGDGGLSNTLVIQGEAKAGSQDLMTIKDGHAVRIMTGAPLPYGTHAVVMKEQAHVDGGLLRLHITPQKHDHIRWQGEDIQKGELLAQRDCVVTPSLMGALYALGIKNIEVYKPPTLSIVSTGDELLDAGEDLKPGQVYYLMGPMLKAQASMLGITNITYTRVKDCLDDIRKAINNALDAADIVLITGGMSKGEYDLVRPALFELGVEEIFYEGLWRPGKPLWFGKYGEKRIFGLPGNPVAAFVCFHVFVRPLLLSTKTTLQRGMMKEDFHKKAGFTFFVRVLVDENHDVSIVKGQGSHQIVSLSRANALAVIPEDVSIIRAGKPVWYYTL